MITAIVVAIIVILVVIITILSVIVTILSALLIVKRKKQSPTVQCDQVKMPEIHDEVDNIVETNQDYQEVDVGEDYKELDAEKMDEITQYASLK